MNYPKSRDEKIKDGTYRADRDQGDVVDTGGVTDSDRKTTLTGESRKFWLKSFDLLKTSGVIKKTDLEILHITALAWEEYLFWAESFHQAIIDIKSKNAVKAATAAKGISSLSYSKQKASKTFMDLSQKLGLNALDRGKLRTQPPEQKDPFGGDGE